MCNFIKQHQEGFCPECHVPEFLREVKAKVESQAEIQGMSGEMFWLNAVAKARGANFDMAQAVLRAMGPIRALVPDLEGGGVHVSEFNYGLYAR